MDPSLADAFHALQSGEARAALAIAARLVRTDPGNARAHLAAGLALRMLGDLGQARAAFERATRLDPRDPGAAYELGTVLQLEEDAAGALACYRRALELRPGFAAARFAAGTALGALGRHEEALRTIDVGLAQSPDDAMGRRARGWVLVEYGRLCVGRGDFARAEELYAAAWALQPSDATLAMYLAQVALTQGHWERGWNAYARRDARAQFESLRKGRGESYAPKIAGARATLVGEQGLGDVLFLLRFAPVLAGRGVTLQFLGDARLHPLLARTGLFAQLRAGTLADAAQEDAALLAGDLPLVAGPPEVVPTLRIPPEPARQSAWHERLAALGPRPWIGVTWRAGTPASQVSEALFKAVPVERLFATLARSTGTVVSLQRAAAAGENEAAARALGRPVHDLARANDDLEDALAVLATLDRYVGVSNTNMHLAAAAGVVADVLVPFPPEWRWGAAGPSPWFPGFRVHRQTVAGDWTPALESLATALAGNGSRA